LPNPAQPDDFALAGARGLDQVEANAPLADYEHLRRASIYQFNRDFEHGRVHYAAIIRDHSQGGLAPDAIFQIGRGYVQQADFTEALKWFERVLEQYPEHPVAEETLLQAASAYARLGKHHEAGARYKRYIEKYPDGERLDRAYLNVIDVLRDEREETAALKWAETVRDKYRGRRQEALALFAEARIYLARTDWPNALSILEELEKLPDLGPNDPGGASLPEVRFLRAYSLEQLHRYPEAIDGYLSIPDGRGEYYGWRATERLHLMAADKNVEASILAKAAVLKEARPSEPDAARRALQAALRLTDMPDERTKLLASLRTVYAAIPAYSAFPKFKLVKPGRQKLVDSRANTASNTRPAADELLFLGLYDEAAPELEFGSGAKPAAGAQKKTDLDYTTAVLYTRGNMANRGAAFAESAWKLPADHQIELIPNEIAELLYPAPFADDLIKHAPQRNVDPRFLLPIIRQESRFRADVKSYAAARGLMQFISTTSSRVAGELGRENFRQDDLYDPGTSILFGSHYTGNLFKLFPRQPAAVAASYNGGEDNMKRWLARSKSDRMDGYVPEIAYAQSKDYVQRVMSSYRVYQMLYDENLNRR
jgi:soluble lytic murein transglycosylase